MTVAVPPAPTASKPQQRSDIQGLRAIAVLSVVAFHAGNWLPGGYAGVDVFFAISGYVITAMLLREWRGSGRLDFFRFYVRRFQRLTPALAVTIAITLAATALFLSPVAIQPATVQTALGAMAFVANFVIALTTGGYFDASADLNPLLHTWSLAVEEQFYLVFPAALFLLLRHAARRSPAGTGPRFPALRALVVVFAVSLAVAVLGSVGYVVGGHALLGGLPAPVGRGLLLLSGFYSPVPRAWEFAAGALLAILPAGFVRLSAAARTVIALAGVVAMTVSFFAFSGATPWPGPATLLPVLGTALVILAGIDADTTRPNPVSAVLGSAPFVTVGDWSYSLYLWHWPCIVVGHALFGPSTLVASLSAAFSLLPAIASYYWLEQPIRRLRDLRGRRLAGLVAATLAPAVAAAAVVFGGNALNWGSARIAAFHQAVAPLHLAQTARCDQRVPLDPTGGSCVWNGDLGGKPVYLVGDSNAGQFSDALMSAAKAEGRPLRMQTANACPFVDLYFTDTRPGFERMNADCRGYVQRSLAALDDAPAGTVVIANTDAYWDSPGFLAGPAPDRLSADTDGKLATFEAALRSTVARLRKAGHTVVVAQTAPRWQGDYAWSPQSCGTLAVARGGCRRDMPESAADDAQGPVRRALSQAVPSAGGVVWDSWGELCRDGTCSTHRDQLPIYRDEGHLTVGGSELLVGSLREALRKAR